MGHLDVHMCPLNPDIYSLNLIICHRLLGTVIKRINHDTFRMQTNILISHNSKFISFHLFFSFVIIFVIFEPLAISGKSGRK